MKTTREKVLDTLGSGLALWILGFALGMMLFPFVPVAYLGAIITPIYAIAAGYVAFRRFRGKDDTVSYLLGVGASWLLVALVFDYVFLVQAFNVEGYYDLDIFLYYAVTFIMPLLIARWGVGLKQTTS